MVAILSQSVTCRAAKPLTISFSTHSRPLLRPIEPIKRHKSLQNSHIVRATEDANQSTPVQQPTPFASSSEEVVFYEGSGSNTELAISMLLGATLVYLPLSLASLGRRLWISYKFTNKRVVVVTNSPVLKREVQIEISKIKEVRTAPRAFGAWGDMVIFLKDGSRLELVGLENFRAIQDFIEGLID